MKWTAATSITGSKIRVATVNFFEKEILRLDQVGFATKLSL